MMRYLLVLLWFLPCSLLYAKPVLVDRIVAIVNGEAILHSEIAEKIQVGPIVLVSDYPAKENSSNYEKAINDSINIELIRSYAEEVEIEVPDSQVKEHIDALLKERGLSQEQLNQMLAEQGKAYEEYQEDVRTQFLIRRFQGRVILPQVKLTDKDIETFYLKKLGSSNQVIELELRQIVVYVDEKASDATKKAKTDLVQEIYRKLQGGLEFTEAVKLYSDESDARDRAGLMPPLKLANFSSAIQDALKDLQIGDYSQPVQSPEGIHLFYVEKKSMSGGKQFESRKQELEQELRMQEVIRIMNKWLESQHLRSKIEVLSD